MVGATLLTVTERPLSVAVPVSSSVMVTKRKYVSEGVPLGVSSAYTWVAVNVLPLIVAGELVPLPQLIIAVNVSVATPSAGSLNVPLTVTDCPSLIEIEAGLPLTVKVVIDGATLLTV